MTPEEQGDAYFTQLGEMIREAQASVRFRAGNEDTLVVNGGMTTLVGRTPSSFQDEV